MSGAILVTGATGFLGGRLVRHLREEGRSVIAMGRDPVECERLSDEGFAVWSADLSQNSELEKFEAKGAVDAVVHCAGLSANWGAKAAFHRFNVTGTRNVIELARRLGARTFIHVSSSSVYFKFCDQLGVTEDQVLPKPVNHYAWSKAEAEKLVTQATGLETTILRPRGIYGKGDRALLPRLIRAAERGPLPLMRDGRAVIDLTHVDDVVRAISAALNTTRTTASKIYNVSGGESVPVREIASRSAERAGIKVRWRKTPWLLALGPIRAVEAFHAIFRPSVEPPVTAYSAGLFAFSQTLDISAIKNDTGWRPQISFEEGLRRTFAS